MALERAKTLKEQKKVNVKRNSHLEKVMERRKVKEEQDRL